MHPVGALPQRLSEGAGTDGPPLSVFLGMGTGDLTGQSPLPGGEHIPQETPGSMMVLVDVASLGPSDGPVEMEA